MTNMSLTDQHCTALQGVPPMDAQEVLRRLAESPDVAGWQLQHNSLARAFDFINYHETLAFVNAVAWVCHQEDHHPTLTVTYNRCVARFDTHSVGGISMNDFICAAKVNALLR